MRRWGVIALAALLGCFCSASAHAAPGGASSALHQASAETSAIEKAHGCHRFAQDSLEGWHRHVGPYCRWVPATRSQQNPYARCRTVCHYVGPIKTCRLVCR
jgi:hypothetical protein